MILTMSCCHNNILINADELVSNTTNIQVQTDAPNLIDNYTEDSISVSGSGISVGISSSSKKYYVKLSYNAYMDYKHI